MVNSSVNPSTEMLDLFNCMKEIHLGIVFSCVTVLLCFSLGTPAHLWILWRSVRSGVKIKPTRVFSLNLTALELLISMYSSFDFLNAVVFKNITGAYVGFLILGMSWIGRLLFQTCICLEQYLAVVHPVAFLRYKGIQNRIAVMLVVWLMAAGYGFCLVFDALQFPDFVFLFTCLTGMTVISFCYVSVLRTLRRSGPGDRDVTMNRGRDERNQQKRNAFDTISGAALIIVLSYSPLLAATVFMFITVDLTLFRCEIVPLVMSVNMYSVIVPPFWKLYKNGEFRCFRDETGDQRR